MLSRATLRDWVTSVDLLAPAEAMKLQSDARIGAF
jgi:hypothetical protein